MTDTEYDKLKQRVGNGKAWVEKIKADGTYSDEANHGHLMLWFQLGTLLLTEEQARNGRSKEEEKQGLIWFGRAWHSKAWVDMRKREMAQDDKREQQRIRRAELADEKRRGLR